MALLVNQILGKPPRKEDDYVNIYAFEIGSDTYIEFFDVNYLLSNIERTFFNKLIEIKMVKFSPEARRGAFRAEFERSYSIKSKVHLVLSKQQRVLLLAGENPEPKKANRGKESYNNAVDLVKTVASWITSNPDFFGEKDLSGIYVKSNARYWSHQNYAIYSIEDFPHLVKLLGEDENSPFKGSVILAVDYEDQEIVYDLKEQIGRDFSSEDPYLTQKFLDIDGKNLSPPIIIINIRGKDEFAIEKTLYSFISEGSGVSLLERTKKILERQSDLGYDLEDLYYFHFGGKKGMSVVEKMAREFDQDASVESKNKVEQSAKALKIDPNDKETVDFLKTFSVYKEVFPLIKPDGSANEKYNKLFFSVVSVPKSEGIAPSDPATKNHELFAEKQNEQFSDPMSKGIFTVLGTVSSNDRVYYLLSSKFCFPKAIFSLFVYKSKDEESKDIDLHDVFEFNHNNGMLSRYPFASSLPGSSEENIFYKTRVLEEFPKKMEKLLGDKIKDNRFDEKVLVKRLSEFPEVYSTMKKWFEEAGIKERDLNIVFVYDVTPIGRNALGGYVNKRVNNTDFISLTREPNGSSKYKDFALPIIFLNFAHQKMQYRENLSRILIHEGKHYFDDIMVEEGKQDVNFMNYPDEYKNPKDEVSKKRAYLKAPVEVSAFKEEALSILKRYSPEYVRNNYTNLKNQMIHNYFAENTQGKMSGSKSVIDQSTYDLYSDIVDAAFEVYERENPPPELETSN